MNERDRIYKAVHLCVSRSRSRCAMECLSYRVPTTSSAGIVGSSMVLAVMNHFSLGVVDLNGAATRLEAHGWHETPGKHRQEGKDGKRQLNVFDPDQTRVEYMEFSNFREPSCSAFTAANPKP